MTEEQIEDDDDVVQENEPIYYKPKFLSLVATVAAWVSWVVIVAFIFVIVAQLQYIIGIGSQNQQTLIQMMSDPSQGEQVRLFAYNNIVLPFFSGLTFFILLQAASVGLNGLLEIDFNIREMGK